MIPAAIDLDLLRAYVAVCRQGSLSRAALVTGRTQPALSMQMRRLEALLGRMLLRRTGRGVLPTPEGELFLGYATRILALGEEAVARLHGPAALDGAVRIALPEEVALSTLPTALGRFRRAHPGVRLDVLVDSTAAAVPLWRDGALDVMVGVPSAMLPGDAAPVAAWSVGLRWTCGLDYDLDGNRPLDLVAFAEPCTWRRRMVEALDASGRAWRIAFTSRSMAAVQAAVENGLGVALLTPECIRPATMRPLPAELGLPEPLVVGYGLYVRDGQSAVADAVVRALVQGLPGYAPACAVAVDASDAAPLFQNGEFRKL